ncbi:probable serine/threonine-protein kinase DDB_G0280111 isoform X2 [Drosophila pseudoobscura]|uniref:Probable serine/threonine-protein kinase DDB_G0280111 isoform X2 n=1 Tax=Drosophila pseudoobscura pseudoobscura TaxID=46245 RepID=A0A0R3P3S9_DROPS|nr:probable serine/threonine-protein kinase DDB_G0280111 isoform X2 [Drosophila pseudoobscura]
MKGIVSCCVLVTILVIAADVHAYRKFGRDCRDIACAPGERCIISRVPCNAPDELEENQCGQYPVCEEVEQKQMSAAFLEYMESKTDPENEYKSESETSHTFHNRSARQVPLPRPIPMPMPIPGPMPMPPRPVPMNVPVPGRVYYPPIPQSQYMGQPMNIVGPVPMMPMIPQNGAGAVGTGGTNIIVEPLIILPMGMGTSPGAGINGNQYYGPGGAYPTYNPYNTYTTSRPYYDYNNYNNNNYNNYNNYTNTGNNNYNDYNAYG